MNKRDGNRPGGATGRVTERQGRKGNARPLQAKAIASVVAALFEATWATSPLANPTGAQVVTGGVTVSSPSASQMNITQSTPNAIVNWNTFSIGAGEAVNIAQPSVSAALLNRVVGNNPSDIAGRLSANGRVFLVNPAGVIFAPGSSVNVGSLVASTLNISDADFLAGRYRFIGSSLAAVRNAGTLSAQARCIELDMQCSAICYASAQLMSLGSEKAKDACRICSDLCDACANECGKHKHEHCRECAEACRECAEECRRMAA